MTMNKERQVSFVHQRNYTRTSPQKILVLHLEPVVNLPIKGHPLARWTPPRLPIYNIQVAVSKDLVAASASVHLQLIQKQIKLAEKKIVKCVFQWWNNSSIGALTVTRSISRCAELQFRIQILKGNPLRYLTFFNLRRLPLSNWDKTFISINT